MFSIVLAPHLDDEIIGCFSVLDTVDLVYYFKADYREESVLEDGAFLRWDENDARLQHPSNLVYLPSKYDYHPLHRKVRSLGLNLPGKKMFYSVEMNTPWLEEEENPEAKRELLKTKYPQEYKTLNKNDKYFLFKSIQPYDDIIWGVIRFDRELFHCWPAAPEEVRFLRNLHRHLFRFEVKIQQFGDDRDLEYFMVSRKVQKFVDGQDWATTTSCEQFALGVKSFVEATYPGRLVEVSVFEDNENGASIC